jgi:hypothetical protein
VKFDRTDPRKIRPILGCAEDGRKVEIWGPDQTKDGPKWLIRERGEPNTDRYVDLDCDPVLLAIREHGTIKMMAWTGATTALAKKPAKIVLRKHADRFSRDALANRSGRR